MQDQNRLQNNSISNNNFNPTHNTNNQNNRTFLNNSLSELLQKVPPEKADGFLQRLVHFLEEQGSQESRIERLTSDSARRQFFKAIYDRDFHLIKLLLTGSRRKYVHTNLICPEDRWTSLHACLYKYNQYPPDDTLRIIRLLLEYNCNVNQPCPDGAVAINVLDKKPMSNGQQNGPENPNREKKTVSFQNKMVLDVAIDFLQAYKWAGCRPSVLANWKPLIELLDEASLSQKNIQQQEYNQKFVIDVPATIAVNASYQKKFKSLFDEEIGTDCTVVVIDVNKEQEIFNVHRAILMSSSPVFHAMFELEMQEKKTSEIQIEDIPSIAVRLMLEYIYSGVLPPLNMMVNRGGNGGGCEMKVNGNLSESLNVGCALLCLSDKYRMNDLKHHSEYQLHQALHLDTCLPLLMSSHRYNAHRLKNVSLNYVVAHFQTLANTLKFKEFGESNPMLLQEILSSVTKDMQQHRPQHKYSNMMGISSFVKNYECGGGKNQSFK